MAVGEEAVAPDRREAVLGSCHGVAKLASLAGAAGATLIAMSASRSPVSAVMDGALAWIVTGPLGRGLSFAIDFAVALRTGLARRR